MKRKPSFTLEPGWWQWIYIYLDTVVDPDSDQSLGEEISWIGNLWPNNPTWTDTSTQSTDGYFLKRAREQTWHTFWCSLYIHKPQQERWDPFIAPRRDGTNTSLNERGKTGGQTSMHAIYIQAAMTAQRSDPIIIKTFPVISTDRPEKTLWVSQMSVWWCGIGVIDQMAFRP